MICANAATDGPNEPQSLTRLLRHAIGDNRCPLSQRVQTWQAIVDKMAASSTHRLGRGNPTLSRRSGNDLNLGAAVLCCRRRACSHALGSGKLLAGGRWSPTAAELPRAESVASLSLIDDQDFIGDMSVAVEMVDDRYFRSCLDLRPSGRRRSDPEYRAVGCVID